MEIFTFRETHVSEKIDGKIVAFLSNQCRLLRWRFAKISKYGFCAAQNIH